MLSALILIPILGALLISCLPSSWGGALRDRRIALVFGMVTLIGSGVVSSQFLLGHAGKQFQEYIPWLEDLGLAYHLGVDGLSLPLVVLNALLTLVALYSSSEQIIRPKLYYALMLVLSAAVTGAFIAQNFLLFFLFYELELIPLYLLIAIWGGQRRGYAATKFLLYTAISGVLVLAACFGLGLLSGSFSFDYETLAQQPVALVPQIVLLSFLLVGFGIKIPLMPFHTWLPDAHVEASTPVSVMLAGVLLKLGTYGLLRFGMGLFPDAWALLAPGLAAWAVVSVLYGSLTAIAQTDMKKMVAYSSIGHMGYILLAMAAATPLSILGAMMQMVSHGLISALLFLLVGVVYNTAKTRDLDLLQGLLNPERGMPLIGSLMTLGVMASAGIPGMVGFISEFVLFRGSFTVFPVQTLLSMLGTILTAVYFLLLVNRAFFGRLPETLEKMPAVAWRDRAPAIVLAVVIVVFGLQPGWLARWSEPTVTSMVRAIAPEVRGVADGPSALDQTGLIQAGPSQPDIHVSQLQIQSE